MMTPAAVRRENRVGGGGHLRQGTPELPFEGRSSISDHTREWWSARVGRILGTGPGHFGREPAAVSPAAAVARGSGINPASTSASRRGRRR